MAYRKRIDESGKEVIERSTKGGTVWYVQDRTAVPEKELAKLDGREQEDPDAFYRSGRSVKRDYKVVNEAKKKQREWNEAEAKGKAAVLRKQEAAGMGWLDSAMVHAGREVDKLGAGLKDIALIGRGMFGQDIEENMAMRKEIADDQAVKDDLYQPLSDESTGSKVGAMLPYLATGYAQPLATGAVNKLIQGAGNVASKTASASVQGGKTLRGKAAKEIAKQYKKVDVPPAIDASIQKGIQATSDKIKRDIGDPIAGKVSHYKNRPALETPNTGAATQLGGAAVLGGLEGAAHYDEDVIDGTLSSMLGAGIGLSVKNKFSKAHNFNAPSENATLKKWKEEYGYRPIPGEETGKTEIQQVSNNMRTDTKFASGMKAVDNANLSAVSKVAGEASGLNHSQIRNMTEETLTDHINKLKLKADDLESMSTGPVNIDDFDLVIGKLDEYGTVARTRVENTLSSLGDTIDGKTYKKLRSAMKGYADHAAVSGDDSYDLYKEVIKQLDTSMENAIGGSKGPKAIQDWKEFREQWAMTDFMMRNGMDANHNIDMKKVASKLMSTDPKRLLTGEGGAIGKFHDIARLSAIQSKQAGGGLGRNNIDHLPGDEDTFGLLSTPAAGNMGLARSARFKAYMAGYPNKTGIFNLPREGVGSAQAISRALQQGTDLYTDAIPSYIDRKLVSPIEELLRTEAE